MIDALAHGREYYRQCAWAEAFEALSFADRTQPLGGDDLELLAMAAYLTGRDEDYLGALDRAHRAHLEAGCHLRAARAAFWLSLRLLFRGSIGPANGWLARAQRVLDQTQADCVERGYVLLPLVQRHINTGDWDAAYAVAADAVAIGERFGEADLYACARHLQGRVLIQQAHIEQGLALLDEAMVAVIAGDLSPLVTGLIYCSVIDGCQEIYAFGRAHEWTAALARWCERQPQLIAFSGVCMAHRAEIMVMQGAWSEALEEARRAGVRCSQAGNPHAAAVAFYQEAEVLRLKGECPAAEECYRRASELGIDPQPGLALLRLTQGRSKSAAATLRRALDASADRLQRLKLLPAYVEVLLATGDIKGARLTSDELEESARTLESGAASVLSAIVAQARGAVELAEGDALVALVSLRRAWRVWQQVDAPYRAARVRVLLGLACRALDDHDGSRLELDVARMMFERLGAAPDLAHLASIGQGGLAHAPHHLSARELQVLRLVAAGRTNKAIATALVLSEKTIDRHVSNILTKLDVPSRAAATAFAYQHHLL
jgi:ATP/maltotriose-dependent transcriptional regulator MalT